MGFTTPALIFSFSPCFFDAGDGVEAILLVIRQDTVVSHTIFMFWWLRQEVGCMYVHFSSLDDRAYADGIVITGGRISSCSYIIYTIDSCNAVFSELPNHTRLLIYILIPSASSVNVRDILGSW